VGIQQYNISSQFRAVDMTLNSQYLACVITSVVEHKCVVSASGLLIFEMRTQAKN
jgi:hypothetical protein